MGEQLEAQRTLRGDLTPLTALDRADIRRELEIRASQCDDLAAGADRSERAAGTYSGASSWRARALRIRQLIALLTVLCLALAGCLEAHGRIEGPPLYMHLCDAMPAADQEAWGAAAAGVNAELEQPAVWVGHGPPVGCSTVDVCPSSEVRADAEVDVGTCVITVRYAPGTAREVATQELDLLLQRWRVQ